MFGNSNNDSALRSKIKNLEEEIKKLKDEKKRLESDHALEIKSLKQDHQLALKEKEFEMKHFKDEELKTQQDTIVKLEREKAVLEKENKMLDKIVDLNADIVDVKDLVNTLIKKLPEINLKSLTINQGSSK